MSMWYFVDGVLILNCSTPPTFTLIWVAKPWMESSPVPESHFDWGVPGRLFSHATGLMIGAPGLAAAATVGATTSAEVAARTVTPPSAASRRSLLLMRTPWPLMNWRRRPLACRLLSRLDRSGGVRI